MNKTKPTEIKIIEKFLNTLNTSYFKLHKSYEDLFWKSYMGEYALTKKKDEAMKKRDAFRANTDLSNKVNAYIEELRKQKDNKLLARLLLWQTFFSKYQTPKEVLALKDQISKLESKIHNFRAKRKEGYIDPKTKKFVIASENKMRAMMRTESEELLRKACFEGLKKLSLESVKDYVKLVGMRNEFARKLGFTDFYHYKLLNDEGMLKKELFTIFDNVYEKTKYAFKDVVEMEKTMKGLRYPWNYSYMLAGDFTKEEDPYFQFNDALIRWGKSFAALGIQFEGGKLQLDLIDRKGKYNNGFCHWPDLVYEKNGVLMPGATNFTCNVVKGQVGSGDQGMTTLFHEGGHAAHLLNSKIGDVCMNHEYAPQSTAWAETQSMFLDTAFDSIEWKSRYAKNSKGEIYPFDLFKRIFEKNYKLNPLSLMGIMSVSAFEKIIYEKKDFTETFVINTAKKVHKKFFNMRESWTMILSIPHIYSWESSAYYHGYGLAELALAQWREYFYDKYGYIIDNPNVGKEMKKVWELASTKNFKEFVILATGKKLSAEPFIKARTKSLKEILDSATKKIDRRKKVPHFKGRVTLNAEIKMVDGKKLIATNKKSFEDMAESYSKWLNK